MRRTDRTGGETGGDPRIGRWRRAPAKPTASLSDVNVATMASGVATRVTTGLATTNAAVVGLMVRQQSAGAIALPQS